MNEQSPDKNNNSGNARGVSQALRLDDMKSVLEARVKAQPENAEAWRELAQVKMMLGDIDGAENDCIECLRIDSKNASGLVLMGNLLTNYRKDDAAAEKYYAQAVEVDPESASAHSNYGTLLFKRGEKFKAVGELRRSIHLDRRQAVARYMLGAMQRFNKMTPEQVKSVATEIAVIGTGGISTAKDANYTLKTIPGEEFSGYRLLANYYVSWKSAFPEHLSKIGLPFDDAYALAQQMYDAKKPGSH